MPFKLTTRYPVMTFVPEGQGHPQQEFYRQIAKLTGWDVPVYDMRIDTHVQAFVDIKDVEQHLLDAFGLAVTFQPVTEHPDQRLNERTAAGDPLYVHLRRVSTWDLRGPWLSAERGYNLRELVREWNKHTGTWVNDPDPLGA